MRGVGRRRSRGVSPEEAARPAARTRTAVPLGGTGTRTTCEVTTVTTFTTCKAPTLTTPATCEATTLTTPATCEATGVTPRTTCAVSTVTTRTTCALATVTTLLLTAACSASGTGARDEGPARNAPVTQSAASDPPSAAPSATPPRTNPVKLVLGDPEVSPGVKRGLRPCAAGGYPIDASYGRLTDSGASDVVVNVMTCDSASLGAYVYREGDGGYDNVFRNEESPVYAEIDHGDLVVTQKVYDKTDQPAYPSSEDVITYRWSPSDSRFRERDRTHNDYSNAVGGDNPPGPEN